MAKHRKRRSPKREDPQEIRPAQPGPEDPRADDDSLDDGLLEDDLPDDDGLDNEELRQLAEALGDDFEIVGQDDEDWDVTFVTSPVTPGISAEELLQRLLHQAELPPPDQLYALSDLSLQDMEMMRRIWELVPVQTRRGVIAELVQRAEEDLFLILGRTLRVALGDSDAQVRAAAVKGLWEDGQPDLIGPLVQLMHNDPATEVRAAAATGLGGFVLAGELEELETAFAMRAEEALLSILTDETQPLEVRRRALESIAFSGETGVRQLIEDAYYSPDPAMRVSAVFAMGRSADVRWRGLVRAELQNPSAAMRAEAAIACGELEARAALNDLLALLGDRDPVVRLAAIYALGHIGGRDARDALEAVMLSDHSDEAEAAENALEEMAFYTDAAAVSFFDESEDEDEEWDIEMDAWYDMDDRELGQYSDEYSEDEYDDSGDFDDDEPDGSDSDSNSDSDADENDE